MTMVSLRAEAESEVVRLERARAWSGGTDDETLATLEADGPWILVARRGRLRRPLGRRVLLVWRIAYEDRSGRIVESRLVPIAVQLSRSVTPRGRAAIDTCLLALDREARALVDVAVRDWRAAADGIARSFASARIAREQAIARGADEVNPPGFQPGLFDRRAERHHEQAAAAASEARRAADERLAALGRSAERSLGAARLLLAVFP